MALAYGAIKNLFGKDYKSLCPFVQDLLPITDRNDQGPLGEMHRKILRDLEAFHQAGIKAGVKTVSVKDSDGRIIEVPLEKLAPNNLDISEFFMHLLKGIEYAAKAHKFNPTMGFLPIDNATMKIGTGGLESAAAYQTVCPDKNLEDALLVNIESIYKHKAMKIANIRLEDTAPGLKGVTFNTTDALVKMGIEEADHCFLWTRSDDEFKRRTGISREDFLAKRYELLREGKPVDYGTDVMELHADKLKIKAAMQDKIIGPDCKRR